MQYIPISSFYEYRLLICLPQYDSTPGMQPSINAEMIFCLIPESYTIKGYMAIWYHLVVSLQLHSKVLPERPTRIWKFCNHGEPLDRWFPGRKFIARIILQVATKVHKDRIRCLTPSAFSQYFKPAFIRFIHKRCRRPSWAQFTLQICELTAALRPSPWGVADAAAIGLGGDGHDGHGDSTRRKGCDACDACGNSSRQLHSRLRTCEECGACEDLSDSQTDSWPIQEDNHAAFNFNSASKVATLAQPLAQPNDPSASRPVAEVIQVTPWIRASDGPSNWLNGWHRENSFVASITS